MEKVRRHRHGIYQHDNPSDALTKALGAVLHGRHAFRSMGMYGSPYATGIGKLTS